MMEDLELDLGPDSPRRARGGREAGQVRRRTATFLGRRGATVAESNGSSTVTGSDAGREQQAAVGVPWLGLLVWVFACAALFVTLIMRPNDLERDRRVAASSAAVQHLLNRAHAAPGPTGQASGQRLSTARHPPAP
jgi:type VI protein secretion system component VasF